MTASSLSEKLFEINWRQDPKMSRCVQPVISTCGAVNTSYDIYKHGSDVFVLLAPWSFISLTFRWRIWAFQWQRLASILFHIFEWVNWCALITFLSTKQIFSFCLVRGFHKTIIQNILTFPSEHCPTAIDPDPWNSQYRHFFSFYKMCTIFCILALGIFVLCVFTQLLQKQNTMPT